MAVEIVIPGLGLGWNSGRVSHWYQPDGAPVSRGDLVFSLESDHVAFDVEAEADGVLRHWPEAEADVAPGQVVALILEPGERMPEQLGQDDEAFSSEPEEERFETTLEHEDAPVTVAEDETEDDAFDFSSALPGYADEREEEPNEHILPLRRSTLPPPPPIDEDSVWAPIPGDETAVGGAWNQAPDEWAAEEPENWSNEPGEPPLKDHREDPRAYFDVAPLAPGVTSMEAEAAAVEAEVAPLSSEQSDEAAGFEPAWDQVDHWVSGGEKAPPPPLATPLTLRVRIDLREARKMQTQLAREWGELAPSDEDVLLRALAHALREAGHGETVALIVPERDGERSSVVAATARFRDAVEALHAGWDAVEADHDCSLASFARFSLDEATPVLPHGHAFALTAGAARDWTVVDGDRVEAVPMTTLSLAYDPARATAGEAGWLLGRIRELVEAPYALLAA